MLSLLRARVQSLVGELKSHKPCMAIKKKNPSPLVTRCVTLDKPRLQFLSFKLLISFFGFGYTGSSLLHSDCFSGCVNGGHSLATGRGLLPAVASLVAEHRL